MAGPEAEHIYGIQLRESANDGSDFANPDADFRVVFLGEDGLLHAKDSAGTVTSLGGSAAASAVTFDPTGLGNTSATDVQAAMGDFDTAITAVIAGSVVGAVLTPSSDTYINSAAATTNNDTATGLLMGNKWGTASTTRFALMTFDTTALAGKTIYSAFLQMTRTDSSAYTAISTMIQARRILRAYVAAQATWNVYSTGNNWTTAGAESAGNDVAAEVHGGVLVASAPPIATNIIRLDVTRLVQEDVDAASTTLRLILGASNADGTLNPVTIASLEHATAVYRPKMQVVYG